MRFSLTLLLTLGLISAVSAAESTYQQAKDFAQQENHKVANIKAFDPNEVPGYQSTAPDLAKLKGAQVTVAAKKAATAPDDVAVVQAAATTIDAYSLSAEDQEILAKGDAVITAADNEESSEVKETFCANGECVDQSYEANQDMGDSLAKLSLFKEMQQDQDKKSKTFFGGKDRRCSIHITNFKNCCADKGWGKDVGLASCRREYKELAQLRRNNLCVKVGTYCADRKFGKCTKKKTTYCCYATKMARLINQQGKRQLRLGWGKPKKPQCKGLTIEQINRLDFNKIDFRELVADIQAKAKQPDGCRVRDEIKKGLASDKRQVNTSETTQGRKHGDF